MNAVTSSKTISLNLVSFSLSSPSHPPFANAWVVDKLDIPTRKFSLHHLSSKYPHLSNVPITPLTEKISILIGADMLELHLLDKSYYISKLIENIHRSNMYVGRKQCL